MVDNTNANNLGESEEEMSSTSSSNSRTVRNMMTGKQMCMADTTPCSDSAPAAAPPPAGFQRLMGHYTRTTSILTDITKEDHDSSPCTDVDIQRNIVCQRCNGLVAGPFFSTCQCSVPLLESSTNPAAASAAAARGGFTTLLRKVTSTFVDGKLHRGKVTF